MMESEGALESSRPRESVRMITIGVVARNESLALPRVLTALGEQTFDHRRIEVILVDSRSTDGTLAMMNGFSARSADEFHRVCVLTNEVVTQAAGWNLVVENMTGDALIRIDAHALIPPEFVSLNVARLDSGEDVCGGRRPCVAGSDTDWADTLLSVENSLLGSSVGRADNAQVPGPVKTVFHAAYRRAVFARVGGFNENLLRTEDNELHARVRQAGYRIAFDPEIISWQQARGTLRAMLRQKYGNGLWVAQTLGVRPSAVSVYHFAPLAFLLAIVVSLMLAAGGLVWPAVFLMVVYGVFIAFAVVSIVREKRLSWMMLATPLVFLLLHLSYGLGSVVGMVKLPFVASRLRKCGRIEEVRMRVVEGMTTCE